MIFWRKRVCRIVTDKRKPISMYFSASTVLIFDCSASHLLRIALFSLIGSISQNHTSTPTAKLLPWHLCYEACLPTSSIPSQAFLFFCQSFWLQLCWAIPPIFHQVKTTFYQVSHRLVTSPFEVQSGKIALSSDTLPLLAVMQVCCSSFFIHMLDARVFPFTNYGFNSNSWSKAHQRTKPYPQNVFCSWTLVCIANSRYQADLAFVRRQDASIVTKSISMGKYPCLTHAQPKPQF